MRLILMFDIPNDTEFEKKQYLFFRKNLLRLGYTMIQYSVYVKCINTQSKFEPEVTKIKKYLPTNGNIRILQVTEKQYVNMYMLLGNKKINEIYNNEKRYIKI